MAVNGLNYDGEMYRWLKSLKDLKVFVEKSLNIKGRWISPGGDVKLFKSEGEGNLAIKWYGPRSQRLVIQSGGPDDYLSSKFETLADRCQSNADILHETEVCSCVNESFISQLVSLTADIASLESRFNSDLVSEIDSLRSKQKDFVSVIRKQDEAICKLNNENSFLMSKLLSLEKLISKVIDNDLLTNSPTSGSEISISNDLESIVNDQPTDSIISTASISESNINEESVIIVENQSSGSNTDFVASSKPVNASNLNKDQKTKSTIGENTNNSVPSLTRPQTATVSIPNTIQQNKPQHYQPSKSQGNRHNDELNKFNSTSDQGNPRNSVNDISNRSVLKSPKHLTPCPFLRRRGFCKKGPSCDFLHRNSQPSNFTQYPFHNSIDHAPPPYISKPNSHHLPFPLDPCYLPPFRFPEYYPMFRPFPGWSQQQTYHPRLRPLMKAPTFLPSHLYNTDTRASQINPACKMNPFQSKSELQLGETESWEAYLQLVNRTLDQIGTLV